MAASATLSETRSVPRAADAPGLTRDVVADVGAAGAAGADTLADSHRGMRPGRLALGIWLVVAVALMVIAADYRVPASASWPDLGRVVLALALPALFVAAVARSVGRVVRALS